MGECRPTPPPPLGEIRRLGEMGADLARLYILRLLLGDDFGVIIVAVVAALLLFVGEDFPRWNVFRLSSSFGDRFGELEYFRFALLLLLLRIFFASDGQGTDRSVVLFSLGISGDVLGFGFGFGPGGLLDLDLLLLLLIGS